MKSDQADNYMSPTSTLQIPDQRVQVNDDCTRTRRTHRTRKELNRYSALADDRVGLKTGRSSRLNSKSSSGITPGLNSQSFPAWAGKAKSELPRFPPGNPLCQRNGSVMKVSGSSRRGVVALIKRTRFQSLMPLHRRTKISRPQ